MQLFSLIQDNQIQQHQQLLINLAMKQAFHVLQLPLLELSSWLQEEIESNPVLEIDLAKEEGKASLDELPREQAPMRNRSQELIDRRRKEQQENLLTASPSLYEHLMRQIPLILEDSQDLHIAGLIIGHLNEKGYLDTPLSEICPFVPIETMQRILKTVQSLDPPGVGASDLQECLLLQLAQQGKGESLTAKIIAEHFTALKHNRLAPIAQQLRISLLELTKLIQKEIAPLDLYPGHRFSPHSVTTIIPDVIFLCVEGKWQVEVNSATLPRFHVAPMYEKALNDNTFGPQETSYLRHKLTGAKWLKRIVARRNQTLRRIGEVILKKQMPFFNMESVELKPMAMSEMAEELGLHESTIARAVANKYLACPSGMFLLKSFFNQGVQKQSGGKISNRSLRNILEHTIKNEDKLKPMTDEELAHHFKKLGFLCSRRTITKYRAQLNISPASKRKKWIAS